MINKKEFDLLLHEISQIESKITELKVLNKFDKANEYENNLNEIRKKAKGIELDNTSTSSGFDELSRNVLIELILLNSEVDYFILKTNNTIESASENRIDAQALQRIKTLWENLEKSIDYWNQSNHNPIEELEYNKNIGMITLEIIINQLQIEGVINFTKVFKYCKKDALINAIKETLFEGAKEEFKDEIRRRRFIDLAKNLSEKDLYDYKLWQQVLIIKNVRSRDDHIEIIGNLLEKDDRKYVIDEPKKQKEKTIIKEEQEMDLYYEESFIVSLKNWFNKVREDANQKRMLLSWKTNRGPAFKLEFEDGEMKFARDYIDKNQGENAKKLVIASDGVAKYNFEKDIEWANLEEIEVLTEKNTSGVDLSPDKTYKCIGNEAFIGCKKLKKLSLGKIELIGNKAFKDCISLTNIKFSPNLMNIGEDAFLGCTNLKEVEFLGALKLYILDRPQNVINCFRETGLEKITFSNIDSAFNFAIVDCPMLKEIKVSSIPEISLPFKTCKYRLGRQEGIVSFIGEKSLNLWKKKNSTIRFFELTEEDKQKYKLK